MCMFGVFICSDTNVRQLAALEISATKVAKSSLGKCVAHGPVDVIVMLCASL